MTLGVAVLGGSAYILIAIAQTEVTVFPLYFFALLSGLIYEHYKIGGSWWRIAGTGVTAYLFSLLFLFQEESNRPHKLEEALQAWPFAFLILYLVTATLSHSRKVTVQMHEGITLLLTASFIYWLMAHGYLNLQSAFIRMVVCCTFIMTLFTLFHAFTPHPLGKAPRLALSIWGSIITLVLSVHNFLLLFADRNIEAIEDQQEGTLIFFQFFLLGISSMYLVQNLLMLIAYLPARDYRENMRNATKSHLSRFSENQLALKTSALLLLAAALTFSINEAFHLLPPNFAIWMLISLASVFTGTRKLPGK